MQAASVARRRPYRLAVRGTDVALGLRTWIVGVLNVTPDSFSDSGRYLAEDAAYAHGLEMFEAGADMVDVGGESTRPGGAQRVDAFEERRRVVPVIRRLRAAGPGFVSIDTTRAEVARAALEAGADVVNDVSGFGFDDEMAATVAAADVPAVIMHLRGDFASMHTAPRYDDVMSEVVSELRTALTRGQDAGVRLEQLIVDPGLGFAKDAGHSIEALRRLAELQALDRPMLVGPSRKRFIGHILDLPPAERLWGTAAAVTAAVLGGAHMVRVHDVHEMSQVVRVADAIRGDC
jgi:dihydropteroate synthase